MSSLNFYPSQPADSQPLPQSKDQLNLEEGEVKVFDDQNYIISDKLFAFRFDEQAKLNWRNISKADLRALSTGEDLSDILMNIEDIAYCDLKNERNCTWISPEGRDAMKVMQAGMQYLMFAQKAMVDKLVLLQAYSAKQNEEYQRLTRVHKQQREKMKRYRKINAKLNEQAIHYEIMINKKRPDLLNQKLNQTTGKIERIDVRRIEGEAPGERIVTDILTEKGVIKEGQRTIFDFFKGNGLTSKESLNERALQDNSIVNQIMESLRNIEAQMLTYKSVADLGASHGRRSRSPDPGPQRDDLGDSFQGLNQSRKSNRSNKSSLSASKPKPLFQLQAALKTEEAEEDEYKDDFEDVDQSNRSKYRMDSIGQSQDIEGSITSQKSATKSPKKQPAVEIEQIMKDSKAKTDQTKAEERLKSPGRRAESLRKQQQTPIKEEDIEEDEEITDTVEEEFSSSNPTGSKVQVEVAANVQLNLNVNSSESYVEKSLKDASSTFVNEDFLRGLGKTQTPKTLTDDQLAQRFNSPVFNNDEQEDKKTEENIPSEVHASEDEYNDDQFERDSQASGTNNQGASSISGLPPLAGGKQLTKSQSNHNVPEEQPKRTGLLPQDFNLNIAESQQTIDFEISDSRVMPPTSSHAPLQKKMGSIESLMRKKINELDDSEDIMDSNDFQVSDSNFSHSFRSKDAHRAGQPKPQAQKKPFYMYEQQKFSSYQQNSVHTSQDEDEDF